MKYYIIAGEASGDLHGSNLMKQLKLQDADAEFRGLGGDLMKAQSCELLFHIRDLAFMGFLEVAKNLGTILGNMKRCKADIEAYKPDVVILIDYPGFNLRIAPFVKELKIPVVYYIAPQVWAWKAKRTELMKQFVDLTLVILPFEEKFLEDRGVAATFVGHPLLDAIGSRPMVEEKENYLALLPGSRKQEVKKMLSVMLEAAKGEEGVRVSKAPSLDEVDYPDLNGAELWNKPTYDLLEQSSGALVTSGTATLETALFSVPQAVCYKTSPLSYAIGKRLVNVPYISLVNLVCDREIVPEFIQSDCNPKSLKKQLDKMRMKDYQLEMKENYKDLHQRLGGPGASERAATEILKLL